MKLRIIVSGTRYFNNYNLLTKELNKIITLPQDTEIISGGATGADTLAEKYALENNIIFKEFPAKWHIYGKSAGPIRNIEMLNYALKETPILIAFWDGKSKGTKHMIDIANKENIFVKIVRYNI